MFMKILNLFLTALRIALFAGLIICMALTNIYGDHPEIQCMVIACCIGNILLTLDYFMYRR